MDEKTFMDLVQWTYGLSDYQRRMLLAYLVGYAPQVVHEGLTWLETVEQPQTPPQ